MLSLWLLLHLIAYADMFIYVSMAFWIVLSHATLALLLLFVLLSSVFLSLFMWLMLVVVAMLLLCVNGVAYLVDC